ncbi:aminopeptidase P family protein [Chelatococcus reniformis]|uniref:Aminopeptidase n=1 Tax=Chelatococcus reniformis TaxID=1494448 RepID=A0A916XMD7_9HYPH|nr:aminopeptidase P family protein [Chelatococcus reniformis]GGC84024.1 aminopeptidase [Chelatococcus reniformis]
MFKSVFQSFDDIADPGAGRQRVASLRAELKQRGLDGFIVPRADEHQGEYVPARAERLAWLTGFTGSAGTAVVLPASACVVVDGRYTLQAPQQVDTGVFEPVASTATTPEAWISAHLKVGERFAYDPWLHTRDGVQRLRAAVERAGGELVAVETNPLDAIWSDQPAAPKGRVKLHDPALAGETTLAKLADVADALAKDKCDALVISDPHNLCWLFNIRGSDVPHTPLALGYGVVPRDGRPILLIDAAKLGGDVRPVLAGVAELADPAEFAARIADAARAGGSVRIDAATAAAALADVVEGAGGTASLGQDPITLLKARKNAAEIEGSRAAHRRDGAAVTRFLRWFDDSAADGKLTEIDAVEALESFRRETNLLADVSFPTIAGAGANGAIVHYRVTRQTNRPIGSGLFLIDSGAQYEDGTTDITRTLPVGPVDAEMRDRFTRVLKGHIAVATAVFPRGTWGAQIDSFARRPLWEAGLDFEHGTGHGVGSFLSVHEGPQRISRLGNVALEPGMILSNEPGYYKTGAYGIRIENLLLVEERSIAGAEKPMLGFETLTLAPFDLRLIDGALLTPSERDWVDAYHARVRDALAPLLSDADREWLLAATAPLAP